MNQREFFIKRKEVLSKIKKHNGVNCVKYWGGTTYKHFSVMSDIVYSLACRDYEVYTEVTFNNGSRADIVAISLNADAIIVEVLHSETEYKFSAKESKYPFPILGVKTDGFDRVSWIEANF